MHQVVEGGPGFLHRVGLLQTQLVGLPDLVDQLGGATVDEVEVDFGGLEPAFDELRQLDRLAQYRATGGFGGVSGEDRAHLEPTQDITQHLGLHSAVQDAVDRAGQTEVGDSQLIDPVDLLCDIGQVEVGGECPDHRDHLFHRQLCQEAVQFLGGRCATPTS